MRRPEIEGFVSVAPPANCYDFSFLAPCPRSGLFVHGDLDQVAPLKEVTGLIEKLKTQKGTVIEHAVVPGANHFFENKISPDFGSGRLSRQAARRSYARRHPSAGGLKLLASRSVAARAVPLLEFPHTSRTNLVRIGVSRFG